MDKQLKREIRACEVCDKKAICTLHYDSMWFCNDCWILEEKAVIESKQIDVNFTTLNQKRSEERAKIATQININDVMLQSRAIDSSINVRSDVFNAKTVAIIELKNSIDSDSSIENKPYELAKELKNRFDKLKSVVFELNQAIVEAGNEQKAIQVYLNGLANQLRAEERERLKISDINYTPKPLSIKGPKVIKTTGTKNKFNKTDVRNAAASTDGKISEFTIHTVATQRNCSPTQAVEFIMNQIKSVQTTDGN